MRNYGSTKNCFRCLSLSLSISCNAKSIFPVCDFPVEKNKAFWLTQFCQRAVRWDREQDNTLTLARSIPGSINVWRDTAYCVKNKHFTVCTSIRSFILSFFLCFCLRRANNFDRFLFSFSRKLSTQNIPKQQTIWTGGYGKTAVPTSEIRIADDVARMLYYQCETRFILCGR